MDENRSKSVKLGEIKEIADFLPDMLYLLDLKGNLIDINKTAEELLGYKKEEVVGKKFSKLTILPPQQVSKATSLLAKVAKGKFKGPAEFVLKRKDGTEIFVETKGMSLKIKGKAFILGISRDISNRKRAEEMLKESEAKYRVLFENTGTATMIDDEDTTVFTANKEIEKLLGYSRKEVEGRSWTEFIVEDDLKKILEYHRLRRIDPSKAPRRYEARFIDKEGDIKHVIVNVDIIPGTKKSIACLWDITDRKKMEQELQQTHKKVREVLYETIRALASIIEKRDPYTAGHQRRVTELACRIADQMRLPRNKIEGIHMAAIIHDIGKIIIPAEILAKPAKLTKTEFAMIKDHPEVAYEILKNIDFPWPVAEAVRQHHERLNGSGYPHGLSGKDIILEARILSVADVVEAMSSHRPYRPAHSMKEALREIKKGKGILYDPQVVDACIRLFEKKGFKFN